MLIPGDHLLRSGHRHHKGGAPGFHKHSLTYFQDALKQYKHELEDDVTVKAYFGTLYDTMLEQNLCRPPCNIAVQIDLPISQLEMLPQMIMDKQFCVFLDQGISVLFVFEETSVDRTYDTALETIQ